MLFTAPPVTIRSCARTAELGGNVSSDFSSLAIRYEQCNRAPRPLWRRNCPTECGDFIVPFMSLGELNARIESARDGVAALAFRQLYLLPLRCQPGEACYGNISRPSIAVMFAYKHQPRWK